MRCALRASCHVHIASYRMACAPWPVYRVACAVLCELHTLRAIACVHRGLCSVLHALCPVCFMPCALLTMPCTVHALHCVLHALRVVARALYCMCCALCASCHVHAVACALCCVQHVVHAVACIMCGCALPGMRYCCCDVMQLIIYLHPTHISLSGHSPGLGAGGCIWGGHGVAMEWLWL